MNLALHLIQLLAFFVAYTNGYKHIKFISSKDLDKSGSSDVLPYAYGFEEEDTTAKRKRRDTAQGQCPSLPGDPVRYWSTLSGDNNFNLALVWVGKSSPTQLLLTTLEFGHIIKIRAPSKLYRRTEDEKIFHQIQNEIKNGDIKKDFGIMKSPLNADKVILISYSYLFSSRPSTLYISTDGARSFEDVHIPFQVRSTEPMQFHPVKEDWVLALDNGESNQFGAWLSTDFGKTWKLLKRMVESVKWETNTNTGKGMNTIYVITKIGFSRYETHVIGTLWRSTDLGKTFEKLADNTRNFGVQGKFLFVSVDAEEQEGEKRTVKVSSNSGDIFNTINIPAVGPDSFFSILDMNEGLIFLHVDEPHDTGYGTLYISDSDGLMYTKSLERHFYTNDGITDFYRVESMRGVFMTHQLDPSDSTITSLITFNRGVTWEPLHLNEEQCKGVGMRAGQNCSLHFHNLYSQAKGVLFQPPLSTETALGLILLHGHQGDALTGKADVYLSNNGGYNWEKVLSGPHHYAIGDHGNLIVAVSKFGESTNRLVYSLDRGKCWHDLKFSDANITVRGLITEPGSKARTFSLWGYESETFRGKEWAVVTVDFHSVFHRVCHQDDFDSWYPHSEKHADGCLLGLKEVYPKVKENAFCFLGKGYKPKIKTTRCKCTDEDKECNFGFERKGDKCVRNPKIDLKVCSNGKEIPVTDEDGYRLIPGDQCTGGPTTSINFVNARTECADGKQDKKEIKDVETEARVTKSRKTRSHFITVFLALSFFALSATFIGFYLRKIYKTRVSGQYRYSQLKAQADEDETPSDPTKFDPRPKGLRPYKDDSDEDTAMLDL